MKRALKSRRINCRISAAQEKLLRKGAQYTRQTLTEFIIQSACTVAESELMEQSEFKLPPQQWRAFLMALDKPAEPNSALRRLLTEPSVIEVANLK